MYGFHKNALARGRDSTPVIIWDMQTASIVRPMGYWVGDHFEFGLEVELLNGVPVSWRATSLAPDPIWLSPGFVNAHSHLEYRGMQGRLEGLDYWPWIRSLTELKALETPEEVRAACQLAASENRVTGVAIIGEHSDRPFSAAALGEVGIAGRIYQELITFFEAADPSKKWAEVESRAAAQSGLLGLEVTVNPHATWSVDRSSLECFALSEFVSLHVAETELEEQLFAHHSGPIEEMFGRFGVALPRRQPLFEMLAEVGMMRPGVQFVHAGATGPKEIDKMAEAGVSVAHCPRSNIALGCPLPDVRAMLDAGILVGLGMDSAASSGPIDMFAEMRAVRGVSADEIWAMATTMGAASLGFEIPNWIQISSAATTTEELIQQSQPSDVTWVPSGL